MKMHSVPRGIQRLRAVVSASAVVALLAGCGGGGSGGESGQSAAVQSANGDPIAQAGRAEGMGNMAAAPQGASNALTTDIPPPQREPESNYDSALNWASQKLAQLTTRTVTADNDVKSTRAAVAPAAAPDANAKGGWTPRATWPLIAIHSALLPDGRVMTYGTDGTGMLQTGKLIYDVWDPAGALDAGHLTLPNMTGTDLFCNAQTLLAGSGQLFLAGGDQYEPGDPPVGYNLRTRDTALFDPGTNTLSSAKGLNRERWYATVTTLSDAQIFIAGGAGGNDRPEVRAKDGTFRLLEDAPTDNFSYWYPRNFLTPDDRIFGLDIDGLMFFVDPRDRGYVQRVTNLVKDFAAKGSSAAMYTPGQILQMGANSNRVARIGINRPVPQVSETAPTSTKRFWGTTTVLPDGKVLVTGGSEVDNRFVGVNNAAEMWDPAVGQWSVGAVGTDPRLYHSSAILLPDATVLVAGGGAPGVRPADNVNAIDGVNYKTAERYSPPYLFGPNGEPAPRPQITSAPDTLTPGQIISIGVNSGLPISKAVLLRTGSVTHSFSFDNRRVPLDMQQTGNTLQAHVPTNGAVVPPGYYMLFLIDTAGVPSVAKIVSMNEGARQAIHADWLGTIGSWGGGQSFTSECQSDEVLAGIQGSSNNEVRNIGAQCVRVDKAGRWIGEPYNEKTYGGTEGGAYTRTCPRDQAVVGYSGRSGARTDNIVVSCEPLSGLNRAGGVPTALAAVGGAGGTERAYRRCGAEGVARGLYGRWGASVDAVGLLCRSEDTAAAFPFFTASKTSSFGSSTGGSPFALSCHSDEVLVGVSGRSGGNLDKLAPLCAKVDEWGKWSSDVIGRGAAGNNGGSPFSRLCPADQAVSGFGVRTGAYVNHITLQCQPLASPGRLKAGVTTLDGAGNANGTANGAACANGQPANGLYGRAGWYIDAVGLACRGSASS